MFTYEEDYVNDDQNVFDEVDAAAIRVASLWFLYFDLFLRLFLARRAASTAVIIVVVVLMAAGCAILGWFIWCHCTSGFNFFSLFLSARLFYQRFSCVAFSSSRSTENVLLLLSRFTVAVSVESHCGKTSFLIHKTFFSAIDSVFVLFHQHFYAFRFSQ